jgi:hypothetical protein
MPTYTLERLFIISLCCGYSFINLSSSGQCQSVNSKPGETVHPTRQYEFSELRVAAYK